VKRGGFLRRTPMRQSGAAVAVVEREERPSWAENLVTATLRPLQGGTYAGGTAGPEPVAKECASQHSGYMAAVRDLGYCMNCGRACRPQFCHADQGKGMGIKTDVRRGWPGCPECHFLIGTSGVYTKNERRGIEARLAHKTRNAVLAAGSWPKHLPLWNKELA
jgi:hypothetical protein